MAEHHLDRTDVSSILEQVSGKRVSEHVRGHGFTNARLDCIVLDDALYAPGGKAFAFIFIDG